MEDVFKATYVAFLNCFLLTCFEKSMNIDMIIALDFLQNHLTCF